MELFWIWQLLYLAINVQENEIMDCIDVYELSVYVYPQTPACCKTITMNFSIVGGIYICMDQGIIFRSCFHSNVCLSCATQL